MQGDAERIAALAHSYTPPDPVKLQQAFKDGNAKLNPLLVRKLEGVANRQISEFEAFRLELRD